MNQIYGKPRRRATMLQLCWQWFHRAVAMLGLASGLFYWALLIGINDQAGWRFDLMPVHWQVASVTLAALLPFAASGLWMVASWGAAVWFLCAGIEVAMHAGFPEMFGSRPVLVAVLVLIAFVFAGLRLAFFVQKRRQAD